MKIYKINSNLYDIRLDLEKVGIKNFLSTWVYKDENICFVVDPGPTIVIDSLKKALIALGIDKNSLNYILLTHIHIDHAGGTGKLISYFPNTKVVCHLRGIKHLINPEKLWDASIASLGEMARIYEKMLPISQNRFSNLNDVEMQNIRIIETLGHAPHHQSYLFNNYIFVGEAGGTHKELAKYFYLRPATPPIFDYTAWKESIQKLINENLKNYLICYPHYGIRKNADFMLRNAEYQLKLWVEIIEKLKHLYNQSNFYELVISELQKQDKIFARNILLETETRKFELIFIKNCIDGILGVLDKKSSNF